MRTDQRMDLIASRIAAACCLALLSPSGVCQELLYGIHTANVMFEIRPETGLIVATKPIDGVPPGDHLLRTTHDGARLFARSGYSDQLWTAHPASAEPTLIGPMNSGFGFAQNYAFEWVPARAELIFVAGDQIYSVNRSTGGVTLQSTLVGLDSFDCVCSMAVNSAGSIFGFGGQTAFQPGTAVYAIDLDTAQATWLAYITTPSGARIHDVAFRSNGELWAVVNATSAAQSGIYRIDLNSMSLSMVLPMPSPPMGIAFGPATETTSYCIAKINSNGCAPTILGNGIASVTASSGYSIGCVNVRNQTTGVLTYSFAGAANLPFGGGTMCVAAPRLRAGAWSSGGNFAPTNDCSGAWNFDFNTWASTHPIAPAGTTIWAQWIGRDSGFAPPHNYSLSNALQFTLVP